MTFYDPAGIPWAADLVDNWKAIRHEFEQLQDQVLLEIPGDKMYDSGWDVFGLHYAGEAILDNCELCPVTTELVREIPEMLSAGFDILRPESAVVESESLSEAFRLSLGLVVPIGSAVVVGDTISPWVEGGCMVYDPSHPPGTNHTLPYLRSSPPTYQPFDIYVPLVLQQK